MSHICGYLTALLLVFCGFTALCLTLKRHYVDIYGRGEASRLAACCLTLGGWTALAAALGIFILLAQAGCGLMLWFGSLTASGWLLVLLLHYTARRVIQLATLSLGLAIGTALAALLSA